MNCIEKGCRNSPGRNLRRCYKHVKQRFREKHPMKQCFYDLRQNARRRGKVFELTFEQFEEFAIRVNLLHGRGRKSESYTVDRIDENVGYVYSNLQKLTNKQNVDKYARSRRITYDWEHKYGAVVDIETGHEIHPF